MIKRWFLLLLFCCVSSVKHSLKYSLTSTTGITNVPELIGARVVDGLQVTSCYSDRRLGDGDNTWKQLIDEHKLYDLLIVQCHEVLPRLYRTRLHNIMDRFNQTGGVHTLQVIRGYEWDEQTGETSGFMKLGFDGEDLMEFDLRTKSWITLKPNTDAVKQRWDDDKAYNQQRVNFITQIYPHWLKTYLGFKNNSVLRTDLPSVSLLQTSPSSPVSCYATGFYPDRAELFWRKDGEQIHEDVDQGEILPNHDGTFQMKVDLDLSSVRAEDWSSYDCVFQLSGVKDDITTKLDKAVIRTNDDSSLEIIHGVVGGLILLAVAACITGCFICGRQIQKTPTTEHNDYETTH